MKSNGLATVLLIVPVLTVPALAIFGIPQFAPVVASPLEESGTIDHGKNRLGNSESLSQDELFEDIEGFDSDRPVKPPTSTVKSRSPSTTSARHNRLRSPEAQETSSWGDDLETAAENQKSNRFSKLLEPRVENRTSPSRYERDSPRAIKQASLGQSTQRRESDSEITQVAFTDGLSSGENRPAQNHHQRTETSSGSQFREPPVEDLTWSTAVERLNELEIRNFRLEPGPRKGLFVFICSYTPPDSPTVSYRFEAEADQPLKAVQKVLEQIVEWRQRR